MTTITRISKDKGEFYLLWLSSGEKLRVSEDILVRQRLLKVRVIRYFNRRNKKPVLMMSGYKWR